MVEPLHGIGSQPVSLQATAFHLSLPRFPRARALLHIATETARGTGSPHWSLVCLRKTRFPVWQEFYVKPPLCSGSRWHPGPLQLSI